MIKSVNRMLVCGIILIVAGISLFIYSIMTYSEVRGLYNKIDFDDLDNNKQVSTSDKYYKHLSISEFLNAKLNQNKNLPIKNVSCVYLDYAQHNATSLYKLIYNGDRSDTSRRGVVEGNIKNLYDMLGFYASCKQSMEYKIELNNILDNIKKSNELYEGSDVTFDSFLNGNGQIQKRSDYDAEQNLNDGEGIDEGHQENNEYIPLPDTTQSKPEYEVSGSYQ